ncbi:MAG: hypothetical protein ABIH71_05440, partial [Candidatus Omnitrophota bacterium]
MGRAGTRPRPVYSVAFTIDYNKYDFTYETDIEGNSITVVHDTDRDEVRRYKDGLLWKGTGKAAMTVRYEYADDKVSKSYIERLDDIITEYAYTYTDEEIQIIGSDNTKR